MEIRVSRATSVEPGDDLLGGDRHQVRGAVAEIDPFLGMADERIRVVVRRGCRAHVGRRNRAAGIHGGHHLWNVEGDVPAVATVARTLEALVPARGR